MPDILKVFMVTVFIFMFGFWIKDITHKKTDIPIDTIETRYEKLKTYINVLNASQAEIKTIKNYKDLTTILTNKFPTEATVNFSQEDIIKVTFSHPEKIEYNLLNYDIFPMLLLMDGSMFTIVNYGNGCKKVDKEYPDNSDCVILVDVNGVNPPNRKNGSIDQTDRYEMIFDGNKNKVYYKDRYMNDLKQAFGK